MHPLIEEILTCLDTDAPVPEKIGMQPFGKALWPWLKVAGRRLQEEEGVNLEALGEEAYSSLEYSLLKRFVFCVAPSFGLEMGIARLQETLEGDTPEERYLDFVHKKLLNASELRAFFEEYSFLADFVVTITQFWIDQAAEFVIRLVQDSKALSQQFNQNIPLGKVIAIEANAGDVHNKGRSVFLVQFEGGKELVYKPKNLGIVKAFYDFALELNTLGITPPLGKYDVLVRDNYGWEEKIKHASCQNVEEVGRYFQRTGMLLCLLYLLDGTDVHYENIIASKEHPFLIDLETLFHSTLYNPQAEKMEIFNHSVLKAGLLPQFIFGEQGKNGVDISGLSAGREEVESPFIMPKWELINTDEMHLTQCSPKFKAGKNLVQLGEKVEEAKNYVEEIVTGFTKMYRLIEENKEFLLREEGPLQKMGCHPVRFVMRPTRLYFRLLQRLTDPQVVLNAELREEELFVLRKYLLEEGMECLNPVIEEEKAGLLRGDIPCFFSYPKEFSLHSGEKKLADFALSKASFDETLKRILSMSNEDRKLQETFIRLAFHSQTGFIHVEGEELMEKSEDAKSLSDEQLWKQVEAIACELNQRAYHSEEGCLAWIDLEPDLTTQQLVLQPISESLYSGRSGIAFFFAALYHLSGDEKWKESAFKTLKSLRKRLNEEKARRMVAGFGIGGMAGIGGMIFALLHLARWLKEPMLIKEAQTLIAAIQKTDIEEDNMHDIVAGCAGLLMALLSFYQAHPDPSYLELATWCGESLCQKAIPMEIGGVSWKNSRQECLLGFSHGNAGIAYALFELDAVVKRGGFSEVARQALVYERKHFSEEKKNWPHLGVNPTAYPAGWCHGATGVGLSRLAILSQGHDQEIVSEIDAALEATQDRLLEKTFPNLCCSGLGRLEFLLEASKALQKPALHEACHTALPSLLTQLRIEGKNSKDIFKPGLMQGMAGVGYTLLRLLDKKGELPQVLLLKS